MLWKYLIGAGLAASVMGVSGTAQAGTSEALLKRLHDKGILSDSEYAELLKEDAAAPAPAPAAAPATVADTTKFVRTTDTGIGLIVGPATIKFSGSVNGFFVHDSADVASAHTAVAGGIANVGSNTSSVRNGLLPGFLKVDATTTQGGWDVGAHFGMYPGINSAAWGALGANNGGQPTALATAGIDFRETYLTFGKASFGEVKIGRAIGLYGSDAILNDITLLSSGSPGGNAAPSNTTLGRIGSGYIYTDFQPQMTYTTPKIYGLQASVGIFQPLVSLTSAAQTNSNPQVQAKLTYDRKVNTVDLHLWLSGITQKHDFVAGGSYTGQGLDMGAKAGVGPFTFVGTWYTAKGLGTTVLNLNDTDALGKARTSNGYYVQGVFTHGKWTLGASYGASFLNHTDSTDEAASPTLVRKNSSAVGQVRYGLNSWMTLIGEYIHSDAKAHNGNEAQSDALALGGILFF